MKKNVYIIIMLLISAGIVSFTFSARRQFKNAGPFGLGTWDLADLNERTVDSTTDPYNITTFDTLYAPHTQCSYQFINGGLSGDSVIYKNYSATPAIIKKGFDSLIVNNRVVLYIIPGHPDTLNYTVSLPENTLTLTRIVTTPRQSQAFTELYSVR